MEARYAKEIAASAAALKVFEGAPEVALPEDAATPQVHVVGQDAVSAILEQGRGRAQFCDLTVLDFASFTHPGGGYERGAMAQEEALCSESFLYNVLKQQGDWYAQNRRRNINCELYRNRALAVPAVRFTRGKVHAYADVIVAAAPNARRAADEYKIAPERLVEEMRSRIRFVLAIADELGHEKLLLGAYGCGVFGWDALQVAALFREELATRPHWAQQVFFAVPETRFDENLAKFEHVFARFPEENPESYAEARARHEAQRQAEAAAAAEDDEDEEEDWRKYL